MGRRNKRPPPRIYHDGLIPATHDTYQSYPEVVGDDYDQVKHEKSYPELAPPQDDPDQQHPHHHHQHQQDPPENQQSTHPHHPSTILTPPTAHGTNTTTTNNPHHQPSHLSGALSSLSPLSAPPPLIHPSLAGLPRTSGVHSLRQAWSEPGDPEDPHAVLLDADRPPLWRRPVFWVVLVAGAVIVVLAGILGGVASGRVGTALGSGSGRGGGGGSTTVPAPVADPACPGDGNRNYTSAAAGVLPKTFRIQCDANYPGGDGALGLKTGSIDTIAGCFDACARESGCVAAVFKPGDAAECWLKEFVGVVRAGGEAQGVVSGVLWQ